MRAFIERNGLDFPQVHDPDGDIWSHFGSETGRATFLFVDDDGSTSRTAYGSLGAEALDARIDELLAS